MRRRVGVPPGAVLFFALLAVTLAVAVLIVRARTPDLVLEVERMQPRELVVDGAEDPGPAEITFFVREPDPRARVSIVDSDGEVVRTLADEVALDSEEPVTVRWYARTEDGGPARPNRYRLKVVLPERDREMIWPRRISVRRAEQEEPS